MLSGIQIFNFFVSDHLKMADQEMSDFCVVFTISLCELESKQTSISSLFQVVLL